MLSELLTRKTPYPGNDIMQVAASVMMGELSLVPVIEADSLEYPAILVQLLKACLKFNPDERPLYDEIVKTFDQNM